jgi:hypothetical protein
LSSMTPSLSQTTPFLSQMKPPIGGNSNSEYRNTKQKKLTTEDTEDTEDTEVRNVKIQVWIPARGPG